jgi:hypothetical protein
VGWREEQRQDRLIRAQISRDQAEADALARIAETRAAAADRREDRAARDGRRRLAGEARAKRRAERAAWLTGHVTDLLFIPVIAVPAILAWTAMSAYGNDLYGPLGWLLPAFSEGGMWVFAFARTITLRRHPDRPTWHLLAGTWVFAAVGGGLNFLHGLTAPGNQAHAGIGTGTVMALVSVAGVTAHQLITAGPRRSAAERRERRLERRTASRVLAVRRAAIRHATALLDGGGDARLVIAPGLVTVDGRRRLVSLEVPEPPDPTTQLADLAADAASEIGGLARSLREPLGPRVASWHGGDQEAIATGAPDVPGVVPALARQPVRELVPAMAREVVPESTTEDTSGVPAGEPDDEPARAPAGVPGEPLRRQVDRSDPDAEKARKMYRASARSGRALSERALAEKFPGRGRTWARNRIAECRDGLHPVAEAR